MINMQHCRMENTYLAMMECINALQRQEQISESELEYARKLKEDFDEFVYALENYKPKKEDND